MTTTGIILMCLGVCIFFLFARWSVHVSMNLDQKLPYDFVTFKTFLKEFNKYKYHHSLRKEKNAIFLDKDNKHVYIHADIVKFNYKCMILYPVSFLIFQIYIMNFTQNKKVKESKVRYRVKGLWKS